MAAAREIRGSPHVLVALAKTGTASFPLRNERRRIIINVQSVMTRVRASLQLPRGRQCAAACERRYLRVCRLG